LGQKTGQEKFPRPPLRNEGGGGRKKRKLRRKGRVEM